MADKFGAYFETLKQQNAAKAGGVLGSVGVTPDQAAEQRSVGKELGVNPFLVSTDPDFYKGLMARKKATTALSQAPKTAQWMQNPENAALAQDDVENIGALEAIGNSMSRFGYGWLQSYNQQRAFTSKRIADDANRSFGEITHDSRTPIIGEDGKEVAREPLGPIEAVGAANRWAVSRLASIFGLESEIAAEAEDFQISAGYYAKRATDAPMTAGAEAVRAKIGGFKPSGSMVTDLTNFAAIVGEDPAGFMSFLAQVGLESAPNMLASAAVMATTRNVFAGATVAGAASGLMERGRAPMEVFEDAGYDMSTLSGIQAAMADQEVMQKAADRGDTRGLIIGLMDAASAGVAGQMLSRSVAGNFLLQSLAQSVFGGGGEAAAQVATGEEFNLAEVLVEALAEFVTAPLEVASMGGAQLPKLARRFGRSGETSEVLTELDQLAASSKLRERAPDKFIEALNAQGFENAEVYVPAEAVREYFQREGIEFDADLMEAWGISADAWAVADATNGDIGIPISSYAANLSGTPAGEMILRNGMLNPDEEMSASDAERFNAEWRDIMEQELREIEERRALESQMRTDAAQIRDDLFGQLRAAGHIPDVAEAETALWVSAFEQAAQLSGENALTLWSRYRVRVLGEASAGMVRRRNQLDADLNTIRSAGVKKGQTAQQQVATARKQMLEQFPELKSKRPFTQEIIARGGVAPGSPAAAELAARGVTVQSAPGLFRKGGMTDLDNIVASEIFLSPVLPEDANGYLSPDGALDAIAQEAAGRPVPFSAEAGAAMDQIAALEASLEAGEVQNAPATYAERFRDGMLGQLAATLDAQGVDLDSLSSDEIAAMIGLGDVRAASPEADGVRYDQETGGVVLFHGSSSADLNLDSIEIIRKDGQKQGKKGRVYGGFYAADESRVSDAEGYAGQDGTVYRIELKPGAVIEDKEGDITRLSEAAINDYLARGVDVVRGKDPRGRVEYAIINKDAISSFADRNSVADGGAIAAADGMRYEQAGDTSSAAFKEWFGDSKVVDADGNPLVVYHGTNAEFDAFDTDIKSQDQWYGRGSYFATDTASFEEHLGMNFQDGEGDSRVVEAYLSIKNPYVWDVSTDEGAAKLRADLDAAGVRLENDPAALDEDGDLLFDVDPSLLKEFDGEVLQRGGSVKFREWAEAQGYDGVFVRDYAGSDIPVEIVAFHPEQIKSVNNRGTWDASDPRILNQGAMGSVQFPAGGIGRGESVIQLFEGANLSTFLHESGHFFLELYGELAAQPGASPELTGMMQTVRDWLGANPGEQFTTAQHEKFARGFEAYLMEGNAPSVELADAFSRFKAWLSRVYESLKSLRVNLTPEVRNVMDRMLASDAAIAEARAAYQVGPMFADRGPVGMSEQDWRTYQKVAQREQQKAEESALKKMMAVKLRETKAWYKEAKEATTKEVTREFSTRRNFRAVSVMASKSWLDPSNTMEVPDIRIDRAALVEMYDGDGILQEISKQKLGGGRAIYAKDGAHPQVVADMFGYASVKEMIEELQNTPKLKDAIRAEVERRMVEQYGDPLSDGSIEEMAIQALHNEAKEQRDMIELRSIGRRIGKPEPRGRIFKLRARAMIGAMSVREASKPQAFLRAERKAASEAQAAFAAVVRGGGNARENLEAAYAAKEREILNHYLYKEARDFEQAVRRGREKFRSYSSPRVRQAIGSPHIERIDDLLETYEFRAKSERWVSNREGLKAYIEAMTAEGRESELSIDPDVAAQADRTHYTRMKVDEFYGLVDTVKNIESMGRLKDNLRTAQKERSEKATIDAIKANMAEYVNRKPRSREKDAAFSRRRLGRDVFNWVGNADTLLREIDGWQDLGAAWTGLKEDVDAGLSRLTQRKVEVAERFNELFSVYTDAEKRDMTVKRPNVALGGDFSKWALIVMALNSGNRDNWQRLTNPDAPGTFNEAALNNALSALDERDWRFVQSVIDYTNSFWGDIVAKEQRQTGLSPKKVEAEVMTSVAPAWFQGGYYPIIYDGEISGRADDISQAETAKMMMGGRFSKAATRKGHTKQRKATARQPVNLDIGGSLQAVNDVIYDLELGEAVGNTQRLLSKLKDTFYEHGRQSDYDALEGWIKDVSAGERSAAHGFGKVMQMARTGFTFSRLGMNLVTVALQPTGIAQSFVVVGKGAMMRGLATYMRNPGRWADDIVAASPMMAERQRSFQRDLHDLMGRLDSSGMTGGRWAKLQREYLVPLSFYLMQKVQFFTVDAPTWVAAYEKARSEGKAEDRARTYADLMVKRSQGSGLISDRGMLERGKFTPTQEMNEMPKLLTALGSYMFAKFNVAYERTMATNWRSPLDAMLWAADMAILFALEAALGMVVRGSLPDDDEPFWKAMLKETGLSVMGTVPFVRDAASGLQGFSSGGSAASIIDIAAVRPMLEAASLASEDGEFDRKSITTAIDAFGIWFNLPSAQVNRMIKAMLDEDLSRSDKGLIDLLGFGQGDGQTIFEYLGGN